MSLKAVLIRSIAACAATAALMLAAPASATLLTNTTWLIGSGEGYTLHRGALPAQGVSAGGFQGDFGANHIEFWCFDLDHTFSLGTPYDYTAIQLTGALATRIAQLFEAGGTRASDADHSAGFQLALWNLEYDGDLTVSSGGFSATGGANAINIANAYLADLANHSGASVTLTELLSTNRPPHQGFITPNTIPSECCINIPEPPALPLVLTALAALALVETRRRMRARGG
jgi:hypothetical protein